MLVNIRSKVRLKVKVFVRKMGMKNDSLNADLKLNLNFRVKLKDFVKTLYYFSDFIVKINAV